jgi:hypothetical protein
MVQIASAALVAFVGRAGPLENLEEVALYSRATEEMTFTTLRRREASVMLATLNRTEYGSSRSDPGK